MTSSVVITFVGMLAAGVFLGAYLDDRRTRDAIGSLFGFGLMAVGFVSLFT